MIAKRKRVLTGSRPSGATHIGNYFGAFKPALELAKQGELFFFLADLNALNSANNAKEVHDASLNMVATMLALGIQDVAGVFYAQSAVPEANELAWMLSCVAPYGFLTRAHTFKDAVAKGVEVNMGVFNYPLLMCADIVLYDADLVPVGNDQKQHLEMCRDIAQRFNNKYGELLKLPEPIIDEKVAVVPGLDGLKMSSSKGNVIPLFATEKEWKKQIMAIQTDSLGVDDKKDPNACIPYKLYELIATPTQAAEMADKLKQGGYGYGHAKQDLLKAIVERFSAPSQTYFDWLKRPNDLADIVNDGSKSARKLAQAKLETLREKVGLIGRPQ